MRRCDNCIFPRAVETIIFGPKSLLSRSAGVVSGIARLPYSSLWRFLGGQYTIDTREQWTAMLAVQQSSFEIWSVHHYAGQKPPPKGWALLGRHWSHNTLARSALVPLPCVLNELRLSMCQFGVDDCRALFREPITFVDGCYFSPDPETCVWDAKLVKVAAETAASHGKMLFLGEYGGTSPTFTGPTAADQSYNVDVLTEQASTHPTVPTLRYSIIFTAVVAICALTPA